MQDREKEISRVTLCGAAVNILLTLMKFLAGLLGHSAAMIADAVHSLSDLLSDIVVFVMTKLSSKGRDKSHDYGHGKFETLATAIVAVMLVVVGVKLMVEGIDKIRSVLSGGTIAVPGRIALYAAVLSIISKEILYQWTARVGKKCESPAVIANAWHHRTDALSSVGAALGVGAAIVFGGKWVVLDPVVCCVISVIIIVVGVKMALPALNELTEASLPDDMEEEIQKTILSVDGVDNVHALKTRRTGPDIVIDAHIVVNPEMTVLEAHAITDEAERLLFERYGAGTQISLHVEPSEEC